jgi:hypothetical protein
MKRIKGGSARAHGIGHALEYLEGRTLLSAARPHATLAAEVRAETVVLSKQISLISGQVKGFSAPDALNTSTPYFYRGFTGHGPSSYGTVFLGLQYLPTVSSTNPNVFTLSNGSAVLTTRFGEKLNLQFTGTTETSHANGVINLTGNVASGNGQFDGETGTFTATGTTFASGRFALSFAVYLNRRTA